MIVRITPKIAEFLDALYSAPTAELTRVFDPWNATSSDDAIHAAVDGRRERLKLHLSAPSPKLLLVGEAPGYQGARVSGTAFTSEALLLEGGIPRLGRLGNRLTTRHIPWREPSATVVWGALHKEGLADHAILWNAFPWHPYGESSLSNRAPTEDEKAIGAPLLRKLITALPKVTVVAVGNVAADSLRKMGVDAEKIRHPSNGGANAFRNGLALLAKRC